MTTKLWKFLDEKDGKIRSRSGDHTWTIGEWYSVEGPVLACRNGFHCSPMLYEAFSYVGSTIVAEVEGRGTPDDNGDKLAYPEMRIVRAWKFTKKDSVTLAVFAAERVLSIFETARPGDDRPRKAIEAAKAYLADDNAVVASYYAAADAAYAAAVASYHAGVAYVAHADDADAGAPYDAANAAANAAYAAASNAAAATNAAAAANAAAATNAAYVAYGYGEQFFNDIEQWFTARLSELEEITP